MEITKENVHKFSKHYKMCENEKRKEIALAFIKHGAIDYDKEKKVYHVHCAFAEYKIKWEKGRFVCNCRFDDCPHVLALYMQLKIWNAERQTEKTKSLEVLD